MSTAVVRRLGHRQPREAMAGRRRKPWTNQRNSKSGLQFLTRDSLCDRYGLFLLVVVASALIIGT